MSEPELTGSLGARETYAEAAVREVLTASAAGVDAAVGYAALLLACVGCADESDRLARRWRAVTGREAARLAEDPVTARAWAMLFEARGDSPDWAAELPPLDLDEEEAAHCTHLDKEGPLRDVCADAEAAATSGDRDGATAALERWAAEARESVRPDLATLAGCRHVAPLLVEGLLTVPGSWAQDYAGTLVAALHARYQPELKPRDWQELIGEIMRLRGEPGTAPAPATPAAVVEAGHRLGVPLPGEYQDFLLTCDGLPADVVFPRLLSVAELAAGPAGVPISEDGNIVLRPSGEVVESDPVFGTSTHPGVRALLEHHLNLLEAAQ